MSAKDPSASESDDDCSSSSESESSSQARSAQMRGDKPHPLRRWAATSDEARAKGLLK